MAEFSSETMAIRKQLNYVFKVLKEKMANQKFYVQWMYELIAQKIGEGVKWIILLKHIGVCVYVYVCSCNIISSQIPNYVGLTFR